MQGRGLTRPSHVDPRARPARDASLYRSCAGTVDVSNRTILVVDDVRFTRLTLVRMLQQLGEGAVHEAEDGAVALRFLESAQPAVDCVISDIEMPTMNGLELLKAIRVGTGAVPRDLRVILLTGQSEWPHFVPALALDVDAFLTKPTSQHKLQECIERVFAPSDGLETGHRLADPETYRAVDLVAIASGSDMRPPSARSAGGRERSVAVADLPAGSVLSRDLLFENGRLLLSAGTQLSAYTLERLRELAAASVLPPSLWVVD